MNCIFQLKLLILGLDIVILSNNKQLMDEVEHDIMNYQNRGLCYLPKPKAEADNCFIIHFSHNSSSETVAKRTAILFLRRTLQGA